MDCDYPLVTIPHHVSVNNIDCDLHCLVTMTRREHVYNMDCDYPLVTIPHHVSVYNRDCDLH